MPEQPDRVRRAGQRRDPAALAAVAVALVGSLMASGCALLPTEQVSMGQVSITLPPQPPPVTTKVQQGAVALTAQVAGQVQSPKVQNLYFGVGGRVLTLNVQNGQSVKQGQVLAALDIGNLQYDINQAKLGIERDQLNIQMHQAQYVQNPPTDQDQASQDALQERQDQLALQQDQNNLQHLTTQLDQNEIIAPFSGVVNDVAVNTGDNVSAYQVVMDISDPTHLAFIANLDNTTATELAVGDKFVMTMSASKQATYHGTISNIVIPTPDQIAAAEESGNPNGIPQDQATLTVTDLQGLPQLGATFSATINIQSVQNALYLPADAVRTFNGNSYVEVYANGVISEVPVTVGLQGDTADQILKGVTVGEEVVEP